MRKLNSQCRRRNVCFKKKIRYHLIFFAEVSTDQKPAVVTLTSKLLNVLSYNFSPYTVSWKKIGGRKLVTYLFHSMKCWISIFAQKVFSLKHCPSSMSLPIA